MASSRSRLKIGLTTLAAPAAVRAAAVDAMTAAVAALPVFLLRWCQVDGAQRRPPADGPVHGRRPSVS